MAASGAAVASAVACGGESTAARWANTYCEFVEECDEYFDEAFDSIAECRREVREELEDDLADLDDVSSACRSAYIALYDCYVGSLNVDTCENDYYDECENEYEDYVDDCEGEDFRSGRRARVRARIAAR